MSRGIIGFADPEIIWGIRKHSHRLLLAKNRFENVRVSIPHGDVGEAGSFSLNSPTLPEPGKPQDPY